MELSSEDFPTLDLPMKAISGTELLKAGRESGDMSEPRKEKRDFCRDLEIDDVSEVHFRVMEVGIVGGGEPSGEVDIQGGGEGIFLAGGWGGGGGWGGTPFRYVCILTIKS